MRRASISGGASEQEADTRMASVMVTGGAGYIGSHTVKRLVERGYSVVTCDNLSRGRRDAVRWGEFVESDVRDEVRVTDAIRRHAVDAIVHFAGYMRVEESVSDPALYIENNLIGSVSLLKTAIFAGVRRFVFSSSAAVYGEPVEIPIREDHPRCPKNPYGFSKAGFEYILEKLARPTGVEYVSLRYFNAAGVDPSGQLGEHHVPETHLVPRVLSVAAGAVDSIRIFGTDYPTPDGTCVRDYVFVNDLADAHILALEHLAAGRGSDVFNLGSGAGHSVLEVIEAARRVTGRPIRVEHSPRRAGDPARLVASGNKAARVLGWSPAVTGIDEIIRTAWEYTRSH